MLLLKVQGTLVDRETFRKYVFLCTCGQEESFAAVSVLRFVGRLS